MKKRAVLSLIFLIILLNFVSASIEIHNGSIQKTYSPYEIISGTLNITIENEETDLNLSSSRGQSMTLKQFLDNNSVSYTCDPGDCLNNFEKSGSGQTSHSINLNNEKKYFGFYIQGSSPDITSLSFKLSSDFGNENQIPLKLQFFERTIWKFTESSDDYTRSESFGCYSPSAPQDSGDISSNPYCEKISIPQASSLKIGATILNPADDDEDLQAIVYDQSLTPGQSCTFNPSDGEDSCIVEDDYQEGEYYICIKADSSTDYDLPSETSGEKCGWLGLPSSENSTRDFAIFAKTPKYAESSDQTFDTDSSEFSNLVSSANTFMQIKYPSGCEDGCLLPISVEGVDQNIQISEIDFKYSTDIVRTSNEAYDADVLKSTLDFSGIVYLEETGFDVGPAGERDFSISLGDEELFEEELEVLPAPVISLVYPTNPPAGVPIIFTANVSGENLQTYDWDFGDTSKTTTQTNTAVHTYQNLGAYTLTLNVTDSNGFTTSKAFTIIAGSPQAYINQTIFKKRTDLNKAKADLSKFPTWQKKELQEQSNILTFEEGLKKLDNKIKNAFTDDDFLEIALELHNLDIPKSITSTKTQSSALITNLDDINPEPVKIIGGGSFENLEPFKEAIHNWQSSNINASIKKEEISAISDQSSKVLITRYTITISSTQDSYLILNEDRDNIAFEDLDNKIIKKAGQSTAFLLAKDMERTFRFILEGQKQEILYASPKLTLLSVGTTDPICEGDECKDPFPWGRTIIYLIILLIIAAIIYTALQIWYKHRYEKFLFKDTNQLFNLVMFITNARARGKTDHEIKKMLRQQGWSTEKIVYAIKKSRGEKIGMYEIIPIEKLFAWFRMRKAKKNLTTSTQQQNTPNINKPGMERINRW